MQDRPHAHELAAAVAEFLFEEVRPAVPRDLRFGVLVAANACAILAREAQAGAVPAEEERERLGRLLGVEAPDVASARERLAREIRAGAFDERREEAVAALRESVRAKLAVVHPGYDRCADDGRG